jgi:uncharacterized protein YecE (DUF72 family)
LARVVIGRDVRVATAWIGTSGWTYKHWENGAFYPPKMPAAGFLPYFATHFGTVEINYSYYQLPPQKTFEVWQRKVPREFVFAVKASRYLTHMKKLKEPREPLERLLYRAGGLGAAFGPVLFQFPARWNLDLDRLQEFMLALQAHPGHRYAFEFRHKSWLTADVFDCLHAQDAALCLPIGWGIPLDIQLTASWTYVRFHGGERSPFFEDDELARWATHIQRWRNQGVDSYSYFNNDSLWQGRPAAIDNAQRLRDMVGA